MFVVINAQNNNNNNINKVQQSAINIRVAEYEPRNNIANDSDNQSWQTTERTLIR